LNFDRGRGAGDTRVVDEHVQATQACFGFLEECIHLVQIGHIAYCCAHIWQDSPGRLERGPIKVADMYVGTDREEAFRYRSTKATSRTGDHNAKFFQGLVHEINLAGQLLLVTSYLVSPPGNTAHRLRHS
jgi:hypothetical protein